MEALVMSQQHILKNSAGGDIVLAHATATRVVGAHTLTPAPRDPVRHLEDAYARARRHLARLTVHDPSREVPAFMTEELFSRLTDAHPAPLTAPAGVGRYTYTPRKTLRRVFDHALDHLNQIDQWLAWQHRGVEPTPPDGWVPSTVTLPDDRLPLTPPDLDAWLWRVDQAARLVQQRAAALPRPSSTGVHPTAAGRCGECSITWLAGSGCTPDRSTTPSRVMRPPGTSRRFGVSTRR
jgi:hypothetical protein